MNTLFKVLLVIYWLLIAVSLGLSIGVLVTNFYYFPYAPAIAAIAFVVALSLIFPSVVAIVIGGIFALLALCMLILDIVIFNEFQWEISDKYLVLTWIIFNALLVTLCLLTITILIIFLITGTSPFSIFLDSIDENNPQLSIQKNSDINKVKNISNGQLIINDI